MTQAKKIPTYRPGDIVLCKGRVERSDHNESVYVRFSSSRECPQLMAADIERLVRPSVKVGDRYDGAGKPEQTGKIRPWNLLPACYHGVFRSTPRKPAKP
ncbi:hypothetical protein NKH10_19235 [Mesorhizobium sp. M1340]|uniref:hypothetical protein n=1 Tax=Mesorhizobium sp. M1340 TaxID=2957087 RepID=UPI003338B6B2